MPWCVMDFPSREARQFYGRGCRAFTTADTDDSRPKAPALAPGFSFAPRRGTRRPSATTVFIAELDAELRTFECEDCGKQSELI
jgi:hypothetical protein